MEDSYKLNTKRSSILIDFVRTCMVLVSVDKSTESHGSQENLLDEAPSRDTVGSLENTGNRYKVNEHV